VQVLTNSTVTTTVLQQTTGASLLGLPLTDWISAGAGVVVAFFAYVTVREGRKNRKRDSIEIRLEKLYNPMFEAMERYEDFEQQISETQKGYYVHLLHSDCDILQSALTNYGHYLDFTGHAMMKDFLDYRWTIKEKYRRFPADRETARAHNTGICFIDCMHMVRANREHLKVELDKLGSGTKSVYTYKP